VFNCWINLAEDAEDAEGFYHPTQSIYTETAFTDENTYDKSSLLYSSQPGTPIYEFSTRRLKGET
jgi:hypothetical protein